MNYRRLFNGPDRFEQFMSWCRSDPYRDTYACRSLPPDYSVAPPV